MVILNNLQNLLQKYIKKYPLCRPEIIYEQMLDDGVISFEVAKQLKSNVSLFQIENSTCKEKSSNPYNIVEIMGYDFKNNINLNKKIEPSAQSFGQLDCDLLSNINALNLTDWGKEILSDSIIPDEDGKGVTVKFPGSPIKEKEVHLSNEDIIRAKKSGNYSDGDDDMIVLELAVEYIYREMVKEGLAERMSDDERLVACGCDYRSYISNIAIKDEDVTYNVLRLLGKDTYTFRFMADNELIKNKEQVLKEFSLNHKDMSIVCAFFFDNDTGYWGNIETMENFIYEGHAFALKKIDYKKEVELIDPFFPEKNIKIPWDVFVENLGLTKCSFKNAALENKFQRCADR